jgi:hypothetical protein
MCRRRLITEPHADDAQDICFAKVLAAAADERVFSGGRWSFRDDNAELQTIHHLGAGRFVRAGGVIQAPHTSA